jgi:hypothetical protein
MFALVGSVLLDARYKLVILGPSGANGAQNAIDRGIPSMFVVDVDRSKQVEISAAKPTTHQASLSGDLSSGTVTVPPRQ